MMRPRDGRGDKFVRGGAEFFSEKVSEGDKESALSQNVKFVIPAKECAGRNEKERDGARSGRSTSRH